MLPKNPGLFRLRCLVAVLAFLSAFLTEGHCDPQQPGTPSCPPWFRVYESLRATRLKNLKIERQPVQDALKTVRDAHLLQNGVPFSMVISFSGNPPINPEVSLVLKDISSLEAMEQIAKKAGLQVRIEEHAFSLSKAAAQPETRMTKLKVPPEKQKLFEHRPPQIVAMGPLRQIAFDRSTGMLFYQNTEREFEAGLWILELLGIGQPD